MATSVSTNESPVKRPLDANQLKRLREILPPERLLTDPADCLSYGYDNSRRVSLPQGVVFPISTAEVQALVKLCHDTAIPLVARGRGTNTTGATVPIAGGLVLSTERMDRILRVSPGDRLLICEAGTLNGAVQTAAGAHGLFWAPDPTSAVYSTVGGNLACNAGGPRAVKYGASRDNVLGLEAVTGSGTLIQGGTLTTKNAVGYDLTRLLIGSEGTLAIITSAALRLLPKPEATRTLRAVYADVPAAAAAVARLMAQPDTPSALEFFDGQAVNLAQAQRDCGLPAHAGALLLIEVDGPAADIARAQQAVATFAAGPGLISLETAATAVEAEALWAARKALSPALRSLAPKKVNEDVVVPVSRLPELVAGIELLSARHALRIVVFGHAGNGNLHVNLLADPDDPIQLRSIDACLGELFRLVLDLEGSLSGEHGVGMAKRDFVDWQLSPGTLSLLQAVKQVFDPMQIMNPYKTLPRTLPSR